MCADAGETTCCLCVSLVEGAWEKLPVARFGVSCSSFCSQNMEALFVWGKVSGIQRSQEFKILV